jgi:hypothetical protein
VTLSFQLSSERPSLATKVSTAMSPTVSSWFGTLVRWIDPAAVSSPSVHRPSTYHLVLVPRSDRPDIDTSIQVPAGVLAFHEAISSVSANPGRTSGDSQVACS